MIEIKNCKFEFACEMKWQDLKITDDNNIRLCNNCNQNVYFAQNNETLDRLVTENKCVAFQRMRTYLVGKIRY